MVQIKDELSVVGSVGSLFTIYSDIIYTDSGSVLKNRTVYDGKYLIDYSEVSLEKFDKFVTDFDKEI